MNFSTDDQAQPSLRFTVLGAVRAWRDGVELRLGSPQQQALLAALLLREGTPAQIDELVDAVWHCDPPPAAVGTARTYLSRLRRILGDALVSVGGGYALRLAPQSLDLTEFHLKATRGQALLRAGDAPAAAGLLGEALGLWQGAALSGIPGEYAAAQRTRLTEVHLAAVEAHFTAELAAAADGDPQRLTELSALVDEYPLREGFRELYMLALYRAGRQADALAAYRDGDRLLRDEAGLAPGPALQRMHQRILSADPALIGRAETPTRSPMQLPADLPDFTGRTAELARITEALRARTAPVVGIAGLAGTGRTALAVRAAHEVTAEYPHGTLYADLAGAASVAEILATWLRTFGADGDTPASACGRAQLLRDTLRGRRVLAVLDNVEDHRQVCTLRTALPDAAILVISTRRLLEAADTSWVRLGPLRPEEAAALLHRLVGPQRANPEPDAIARLVSLSAGYPLPLRLIGERLRLRPRFTVAELAMRLARELDDAHGPIHDDCVTAEAPLLRTYERLSRQQARVLHTAAMAGRPEFTAPDVAALSDLSEHQAWNALEALVEVSLLHETGMPGRYRFDAYVHAFARRTAVSVVGAVTTAARVDRQAHRPRRPAGRTVVHIRRGSRPAGRN
ncbi:BTAD domain-containing putative transcriptional regulator [Micromonospora sp. NPDC005324]|uniref:AfsR/SARP family transcriptional regulator n=1 Tax=Micromonospora sp. NPDC005324 TaxID=3157033 RepID=UPI0033BDCAA5